jgi:hypothetical protein
MSGAVAAHAAYNGAGTQGLAVTNKINDTGDVMSVFWTKHDTTRQLLHGSSIVEIVSSGSSGTTNAFGSSRIFTVNNDVDVLGDLYLELTLNVALTAGTNTVVASIASSATGTSHRRLIDYELDNNFQFKLIDRVEFMVGTQIWHTLTGNDIKVLTKTSKSESCSDTLAKQIASERFLVGSVDQTVLQADSSSITLAPITSQQGLGTRGSLPASENTRVVLWIPAMSADLSAPLRKFYNITENGYIMAAAPQQSVKIKITFATGTATGNFLETQMAANAANPFTRAAVASAYPGITTTFISDQTGTLDLSGAIFDLPLTNSESVPAAPNSGGDAETLDYYPFKRVVLGYGAAFTTASGQVIQAQSNSINMTIGRVRLFGKQIMLCKEERDQIRSVPNGLPYRIKMSQSIRAELPRLTEQTIDLDSFSLYASHLIISGDWAGNTAHIISAELKLNSSSFSGEIPSLLLKNDMAESLNLYSGKTLVNSHVQKGTYTQNLGRFEKPYLIFPLASTAFSGSSVPLNRFDSIRLILKYSVAPSNITAGRRQPELTTFGITVTCVGETTVLYKGGAATLAMY